MIIHIIQILLFLLLESQNTTILYRYYPIKLSNHYLDVFVYLLPAVTPVPVVLHWLTQSARQDALGGGQFEGEDEIIDLFEVGSQVDYLRYYILQTDNITSNVLLHLRIRFYLHSVFTNFPKQLFVDKFAHYLFRRFTPGDVIFYLLQLPDVGRGSSNESCSIDFFKVELGEDYSLLLGYIEDSSNSDDQQELAHSADISPLSLEDQLQVLSILDKGGVTFNLQWEQAFCWALYCLMIFSGDLMASLLFFLLPFNMSLFLILVLMAC